MSQMGYRCKHCKSTNVQGTLPAWFMVNEETLDAVDVDAEADWEYGYCEECEASGDFYSLVEKIPDSLGKVLPCPYCKETITPADHRIVDTSNAVLYHRKCFFNMVSDENGERCNYQ